MDRQQLMRELTALRDEFRRISLSTQLPSVFDVDLTTQQWRVLYLAANEDRLTANSLCQRFGVSAATVSGLLQRLEGRGLVQRESDSQDHRVKLIRASSEGQQIIREASALDEHLVGMWLEELDDEELQMAAQLMGKMVEVSRRCAVATEPGVSSVTCPG